MTNPYNVGGLPAGMVMVQRSDAERIAKFVGLTNADSSVQLSARRVLELCRADPAGGDKPVATLNITESCDGWLDCVPLTNKGKALAPGSYSVYLRPAAPAGGDAAYGWVLTGPEGSMFCPATHRYVMEATIKADGCSAVAVYTRQQDSAPAGSEEVVVPAIEQMLVYAYAAGMNGDNFDMLAARRNLSALLRKLQQGAE